MNTLKKITNLLIFFCFSAATLVAQGNDEVEVNLPETESRSSKEEVLIARATEITTQRGFASYYADKFQGNQTSSGEVFDNALMTAAHNSLAFGTMVRVTNLSNNLSVIVKINDRGPFKPGRVIDLSRAAAEKINLVKSGVVEVKVEVLNEKGEIKKPVIPVKPKTETPSVGTEIVGTGLYKISPTGTTPTGFGIQIGAYSDYRSMFHYTHELHKKGITNTMIHSGFSGEKPIYRLIIGPFEDKGQAEKARAELATQNIDGVVLSVANLK